MSDVIVAVDRPQFVKKTHELASLYKLLDAGSKDAVELVINTMNAEKVELKMRIQCAEKIIDLKIKVAESMSKDQLTRQIAEVKVHGIVPLGSTTDAKPKGPVIDFDNIQEV